MGRGYIDADGHVMENERELNDFLEEPFKSLGYLGLRQMVPTLDGFHVPRSRRRERTFDRAVGPDKWLEFLEKTGIEHPVLYPTVGLAIGQIVCPEWALAYAKIYNDWLYEKYLSRSSRFKGIAIIPLQDPVTAVVELRRAVEDLGMLGGMIPSNGLKKHIAAQEFWPIYKAAQDLDCVIAVHGGSYSDLGFNTFTNFSATRALGMPFPLAIAMTGMIVDGVLDAFPRLRIGFLEGGASWIPLVIDRLSRELEYGELQLKRSPEEYFRSGQIFVGCEGSEKALSYAIERVGHDLFMFGSDFPHEITLENCTEEIGDILNRKDIRDESKEAILGANARRFYKI